MFVFDENWIPRGERDRCRSTAATTTTTTIGDDARSIFTEPRSLTERDTGSKHRERASLVSGGLRWIGEKKRREKKTEKERKEGEGGRGGGKKKKGGEIIEIQASCFATSSRERTRTAATTTKFHRAAGTSCETRVLVWNGDRGRSQVQNPCASTSQGLGFGVTFAGIFVSTSDFTSFRCLGYMSKRIDRARNVINLMIFVAVRTVYIFVICSANVTNILANISYIGRQLSPLPGEFPLNPVKRIISHEEIRIINFFKCSSSRFVFVTLLFSTISVVWSEETKLRI